MEKPEKLMYDGTEMQLLGGQAGKPVSQVESLLGAEYGIGSGSRAIAPELAVFDYVLEQVEVLLHAIVGELFLSSPCRRLKTRAEGRVASFCRNKDISAVRTSVPLGPSVLVLPGQWNSLCEYGSLFLEGRVQMKSIPQSRICASFNR